MSRIIIGRPVEAGPQGEHVQALIERLDAMTPDEARALVAGAAGAAGVAWATPWAAAWAAARAAARATARAAAWDAARDAARATAGAWDAAGAAARAATGLLVRDRIDTAHYDALTMPVRSVLGPIHPDDPEVTR